MTFDSKVIPGVVFVLHKPSYGRTLDFDIKNAKFRQKSRELQQRQDALREEYDYVRKQWDTEQESRLKSLRSLLAAAGENPGSEADTASIQGDIDKIEHGYEYERLLDRSKVVTEEAHVEEIAKRLVEIGDNKISFEMPRELAAGFRELRDDAESAKAEFYYPQRLRWGLVKIEGIEIDGAPATPETLLASGPTDLTREILLKIDEISSMSAEELRNFRPPSSSTAPEGGLTSDTIAEHAKNLDSTVLATA